MILSLLNSFLNRFGLADLVKADQTALDREDLMKRRIGKHTALEVR